jgi:signal transduction histidine kinase
LVAYRTAQEALTNISKHAQATRVVLDLSMAGQVLSLEISDNGRGLSDTDLAKAKSFGIRGLHERAGTVGGWIDISSTAQGTTLLLSVPLDQVAQAAQLSLDDAMNMSTSTDSHHNPSAWGDL